MPAAAGAVRVPYRTFLIYNVVGGVVWGVGYCLLGYLAGSAYAAVESRVGTGLAIAVAAVVVAAVAVWAVRRHRAGLERGRRGPRRRSACTRQPRRSPVASPAERAGRARLCTRRDDAPGDRCADFLDRMT